MRSGTLTRKTRLASRTPLKPSPLRKVSRKRAKRMRDRAKMRATDIVPGVTVCEWPEGCAALAVQWHHRRKLSRLGSDERSNRVWLCFDHHEWVETHETEAHAMNLSRKSWEAE